MAASILRRTLIPFFSRTNFSVSLNFSTKSRKLPLDNHTVAQFLVNNHRFSPDAAALIASQARCRLRTQQKADSVIAFLKDAGFSNHQLEKTFQSSPHLLSAHLETNIKPKFQIFTNHGFTPVEIVEIVSNQSPILRHSAPRISYLIVALKDVLGSAVAVAKLFKTFQRLFLRNIDINLLPNVEFLKSCGVSMKQITRSVIQVPRFLVTHRPEDMRRLVEKAEEMGADRKSRTFIYAVRVVSSMSDDTLGVKMKALRELGFSDEDIARAFRSSPKVFSTSPEKIRRVAEALEGSGRYDMMSIVGTPNVFTYSVEKRIMPRLRVLGALEEKNLLTDWPKISTMICITDVMFFERFVKPHLGHVGGLWK